MARKEKYTLAAEKIASNRYSSIKARVDYKLSDYWTRDDFIKWYTEKDKVCCYCGCTEKEISDFYSAPKEERAKRITRGKSLEIERKKDQKYSEDNCELSCYWCNNAKSDVFTYEEFIPIGKVIGDTIKKRLSTNV